MFDLRIIYARDGIVSNSHAVHTIRPMRDFIASLNGSEGAEKWGAGLNSEELEIIEFSETGNKYWMIFSKVVSEEKGTVFINSEILNDFDKFQKIKTPLYVAFDIRADYRTIYQYQIHKNGLITESKATRVK